MQMRSNASDDFKHAPDDLPKSGTRPRASCKLQLFQVYVEVCRGPTYSQSHGGADASQKAYFPKRRDVAIRILVQRDDEKCITAFRKGAARIPVHYSGHLRVDAVRTASFAAIDVALPRGRCATGCQNMSSPT
eukprot:5548733-Pleurochrysis_carterae.AAC.1